MGAECETCITGIEAGVGLVGGIEAGVRPVSEIEGGS